MAGPRTIEKIDGRYLLGGGGLSVFWTFSLPQAGMMQSGRVLKNTLPVRFESPHPCGLPLRGTLARLVPAPACTAKSPVRYLPGLAPRLGSGGRKHHFICEATKSQFTRFQNASTYFGRALR
jgi:hypothetical protein